MIERTTRTGERPSKSWSWHPHQKLRQQQQQPLILCTQEEKERDRDRGHKRNETKETEKRHDLRSVRVQGMAIPRHLPSIGVTGVTGAGR